MRRRTDSLTVQVLLAAPLEILVLADHRIRDVVVTRLVLGSDQTVDLVTSRLRIMSHVLIDTSFENSIHFLLAVQHVTPVIRVRAIKHHLLNMQLGRVLRHFHFEQRVARVLLVVLAFVNVRLAVEINRLTVTDSQWYLPVNQLLNG